MRQLVPSLNTGTMLDPPPATMLWNVVALAFVTIARAPTPTVAADGKLATKVAPGPRVTMWFELPIVISLLAVADEASASNPMTMLFDPVVIELPA